MNRLIGSALLLVLCAACTGGQDEAETEGPADAGVLEPHRQVLERAREAEDNVAAAARAQREALERQEAGEQDGDG